MSTVEENAFQTARFLLENPGARKHSFIKNALEFSDEDFQYARKFLVDGGYVRSAGQSTTGEIVDINLVELQKFVNHMSKNRISLSLDAEHLLKHLTSIQAPSFPLSLAEHVMKQLAWGEEQYMEVAQELDDNGFVKGRYADGNPFFQITVTSEGRKAVRNNFQLPNVPQNPLQIVGNNNIVNVGSTLNSVQQFIQTNSLGDVNLKQELEALLKNLEDALRDVPLRHEDDAEAVATMAKNLIENATGDKKNRTMVEISADGLIKAAKNISLITPSVLVTAQAIIDFIQTNFPV